MKKKNTSPTRSLSSLPIPRVFLCRRPPARPPHHTPGASLCLAQARRTRPTSSHKRSFQMAAPGDGKVSSELQHFLAQEQAKAQVRGKKKACTKETLVTGERARDGGWDQASPATVVNPFPPFSPLQTNFRSSKPWPASPTCAGTSAWARPAGRWGRASRPASKTARNGFWTRPSLLCNGSRPSRGKRAEGGWSDADCVGEERRCKPVSPFFSRRPCVKHAPPVLLLLCFFSRGKKKTMLFLVTQSPPLALARSLSTRQIKKEGKKNGGIG